MRLFFFLLTLLLHGSFVTFELLLISGLKPLIGFCGSLLLLSETCHFSFFSFLFDLLLSDSLSYCIYYLVYRLNSLLIFPPLSCCLFVLHLLAGLVFSLIFIRSI